ncbi:MAG: hypothetical protein FJ304_01360 [Planctomycetes bacterium]|nr:hypothetical protein [Planctomycetota bacterium]
MIATVALAFSTREIAAEDAQPNKPDSGMKRRAQTTDEELRKQLQALVETGFDQPAADALYGPLVKRDDNMKNFQADLGPKFFTFLVNKAKRTEQLALPWHTGANSEMGKEAAEELQVLSVKLRAALRKSVKQDDVRPDPEVLRKLLTDDEWATAKALPTLTQMMQGENTPIRLLLVEMLAKIKGKEGASRWPGAPFLTCRRMCARRRSRHSPTDPQRSTRRSSTTVSGTVGLPPPTTPPKPLSRSSEPTLSQSWSNC